MIETRAKRALLYGFFSQGNYGDDALLGAIVGGLRRRIPSPLEIEAAVRYPSTALDRQFGISTFQNLEYDSCSGAIGKYLHGYNYGEEDAFQGFLRHLVQADLVVIGPGQYFVETGVDALWKGIIAQFDAVTELCSMTGTRVFGMALTCEELRNSFSLVRLQNAVGKLSALSFRDERSATYLQSLGICLPPFTAASDLAFSDDPRPRKDAGHILKAEGIPVEPRRLLGVAVNDVYSSARTRERVGELVIATIDRWVAETDGDVLLIPQSVNHEEPNADDRVYHASLFGKLPPQAARRVHRIRNLYDYEAIEPLYSLCEVALCTRMHGAIFALRQGVPALLVDYEWKRRACFEQLGLEHLLCSLDSTPDMVITRLQQLGARHSGWTTTLEAVTRARQSSQRHLDIAASLLNADSPPQQQWVRRVLSND